MTAELTSKADSIVGRERSRHEIAPTESIASMDNSQREALLGTLETYRALMGTENAGNGSATPRDPNDTVPPPDEAAARTAAGAHPGGGFKLLRKISQGGVGEVWEGRQHSLQRVIAVKRLRDNLPPAPDLTPEQQDKLSRAAFIQEALIAASLAHPNVIPVYDLGVDEQNAPLLAMKLVHGRVWADALAAEEGRASDKSLRANLEILLQVCNAVAFSHSRHIIHRDLKPAQVMLGEYGEVLLMDWGLAIDARLREEIPENEIAVAPPRDEACSPAGTPVYMAPEQVLEVADRVSKQTDVFLLGAMLYEILAGEPPHAADTVEQALERAHAGYVEHPAERAPHRYPPPVLCAIAMRALSVYPEERYESASQFAEMIESFLAGESRRDESRQLYEQALQDYREASRGEYLELARIDANLTRALVLWPENQPAAELRQTVLREYAASAVAGGDLKLAQLLGVHFDSAEDMRDLREQIALAERQRSRHIRQRRMATAAATTLATGLLVMGWLLYGSAERSRREAQQGELIALDAANNAISSAARAMTRPLAGAPSSRIEEIENLKALFAELESHFPESQRQQAERARLMVAAFETYRSHGSPSQATLQLLEAAKAAERAAQLDPNSVENAELLVDVYLRVAQLHAEAGESEAAFQYIRKAQERLKALEATSAERPELRKLHRAALLIEGKAWLAAGSVEKALPLYLQSVEVSRALVEGGQARAAEKALAESLGHVADARERLNQPEQAAAALDELLQVAERRASAWEDDPQAQRDLALAYEAMHKFLHRSGQFEKAEKYLARSIDRQRRVAESRSSNMEYRQYLAESLARSADHFFKVGKLERAAEEIREAVEALERVAREMPSDYGGARQLAEARTLQARVETARDHPAEAREAILAAMETAERLLGDASASDVELLELLGEILVQRARIAAAAGNWEETRACYQYWMDREPLYLSAARDKAAAELTSIRHVSEYVRLFESQPFEQRLKSQLPVMRALADKIAAFAERGPEAREHMERLREEYGRLRMRIDLMSRGLDPDAPETPPAWDVPPAGNP